jgi:hypothetical protein
VRSALRRQPGSLKVAEVVRDIRRKVANGGLSRDSRQSPDSDLGHSQGELAECLRRIFGKLPFQGGSGWRPGSTCTTRRWRELRWAAESPFLIKRFRCQSRTRWPIRSGLAPWAAKVISGADVVQELGHNGRQHASFSYAYIHRRYREHRIVDGDGDHLVGFKLVLGDQ